MPTIHAAAAKEIRKELKRRGIRASVRSSSYSMGSSVNVKIRQDILPATRERIESFCGRYQYGHFDPMQDLYEISNRDDSLPQVKHVFVEVQWSDEIVKSAKRFAENRDMGDEYWSILSGRSIWADDFWADRKPRQRAT